MNHSGHFEPKTGLNDSLKETEKQFAKQIKYFCDSKPHFTQPEHN